MKIEELEETIADLKTRRGELAREEQDAREAEKATRSALATGTGSADDAAAAHARITALARAATELDDQIGRFCVALETARANARRDARRASTAEIAQYGARLWQEFNEECALMSALLSDHAPRAVALLAEIEQARERFRKAFAEFAEVEPHQTFGGFADDAACERMGLALREMHNDGASEDFMMVPDNALKSFFSVAKLPYGTLVQHAVDLARKGQTTQSGGFVNVGGTTAPRALWPDE
jgi:hypothetical protein